MKFSLFKNDKSSAMDELILFLIIVVCLTIGILLIIYKPTFWVINSSSTKMVGG